MELFDLSRLTRKKPDMSVNLSAPVDYKAKAFAYAQKELLRNGLVRVCCDALPQQVTKENWVRIAQDLINDTLAYDYLGM